MLGRILEAEVWTPRKHVSLKDSFFLCGHASLGLEVDMLIVFTGRTISAGAGKFVFNVLGRCSYTLKFSVAIVH